MKKLLILGGSHSIIPAIKAAHKLGVYVITCDYLPDNIGHRYSDEYHNVSIIEKEKVLELAESLQVDGILSFATDPGVEAAAYAAEKLGLPTPPYKSIHILQNKNLFRTFLKEHGFNVPWFKSYLSAEDAIKEADTYPFPVIIKPVDSAGSKGVKRVDREEDLKAAIQYALSYSHNGRFIIEEFIQQEGHDSGSDCFALNGKLVFTSFSSRHFDDTAVNPWSPIGHTWPSDMPKKVQQELKQELQRLIQILHLGSTAINVDSRLGKNGKAYLMEVSPRVSGLRVAEVLKYASRQDLIDNSIKAALGIPLSPMHDPEYHGYWGVYVLHAKSNGVFDYLWIDPEIRKRNVIEQDVWVNKGDKVHSFTGANEIIGTVIFRGESFSETEDMMTYPERWIKVMVK